MRDVSSARMFRWPRVPRPGHLVRTFARCLRPFGVLAGLVVGCSSLAHAATVDLFVSAASSAVAPGGRTSLTLQVGNLGAPSTSGLQLTVTTAPYANTQGVTRVTFSTPVFVNIDRAGLWPSGCRFLYENLDPAVPEMVECLIDAPIPAGGQVLLPIPLRLVAGAPNGVISGRAIVRPQTGSPDAEQSIIDNVVLYGVVISELPAHTLRFFLHSTDLPPTAGGFTMNLTPAPSALAVNLLTAPRWFSAPALVGTFDPEARFRVVMPCLVGLGLGVNYALESTDLNGSDRRPLGQTSALLSLCLGQQAITIPVLTPVSLDQRRLGLTVRKLAGVLLPLGSGTYLEGTVFRGTP